MLEETLAELIECTQYRCRRSTGWFGRLLRVTREEAEKAVDKLQNGKAAGDDRIVLELLEDGGEAMTDRLWGLLQMVWWTRQVPRERKGATLH